MIYRHRKEDLESQLNKNALWAIVYGDMMSYLMILFLLMLSFTLSQKTVEGKVITKTEEAYISVIKIFGGEVPETLAGKAEERERNKKLEVELQTIADQGELGKDAKVIVTEKRITVGLGEEILFDSGRAELKPEAETVIERVGKTLANRKNEIRVEGHTDSVPIRRGAYKSNWELSMARAYAVVRRLEAAGIDPKKLSGIGYGENRPVADNTTAEGRAKNRRIEISLLREE